MKKKLTMINNIVCAILLIATFATMLLPWQEYDATEKVKVRRCRYCGTAAELDENNKVRDGYVCPGTAEVTLKDYEKYKVKTEEVETTEPVVDATEPVVDTTEPVEATEAADVAAEPEATEAVEATEPAEEAEPTEPVDENATVTVACTEMRPRYQMLQEPVYHHGETSVMDYIWMTRDHKDLTKKFEAEGIAINDIVLAPFVLTLCGIVGLLFCLFNMKGTWHSIFLLPAGGFVVFEYLTNPIFQQKQWMLTLGCAIALSVFSLLLFVQWAIKLVRWFAVPSYKK